MEKEKILKLEKRVPKEKNSLEKIEFNIISCLVVLFLGIMVGSISGAISLYNGTEENDITDLDTSRLINSPTEEETTTEETEEEQEEDYLDADKALDELLEDNESN